MKIRFAKKKEPEVEITSMEKKELPTFPEFELRKKRRQDIFDAMRENEAEEMNVGNRVNHIEREMKGLKEDYGRLNEGIAALMNKLRKKLEELEAVEKKLLRLQKVSDNLICHVDWKKEALNNHIKYYDQTTKREQNLDAEIEKLLMPVPPKPPGAKDGSARDNKVPGQTEKKG